MVKESSIIKWSCQLNGKLNSEWNSESGIKLISIWKLNISWKWEIESKVEEWVKVGELKKTQRERT